MNLFFHCILLLLLIGLVLSAFPDDEEALHKDYISPKSLKDIPEVKETINKHDENGFTPLMNAVRSGHFDATKNLIAGGADINQLNPVDGNSALFYACSNGHFVVAMELLASGADLKIRNNKMITPFLLALYHDHTNLVEGILTHYTRANPVPLGPTESLEYKTVNIAHDGGTVVHRNVYDLVNEPMVDGTTPIIVSTHRGQLPITKLLVERGADVNVHSAKGDTPLMFASAANHKDVVIFLLSLSNVNTNQQNLALQTALMFAAWKGHTEVLETLLESGRVDIDIRDGRGRNALDHAILSSQQASIEILVAWGIDCPRGGYRVTAETLQKRKQHLNKNPKDDTIIRYHHEYEHEEL